MVITVDIWMDPTQEHRYRHTRNLPDEGDVRPHVVGEIGREITGIGAIDDIWDVEVRGRDM